MGRCRWAKSLARWPAALVSGWSLWFRGTCARAVQPVEDAAVSRAAADVAADGAASGSGAVLVTEPLGRSQKPPHVSNLELVSTTQKRRALSLSSMGEPKLCHFSDCFLKIFEPKMSGIVKKSSRFFDIILTPALNHTFLGATKSG